MNKEAEKRIAVHNMSIAIKKVRVQCADDVTRDTMNCFGGAGDQLACEVADMLGILPVSPRSACTAA